MKRLILLFFVLVHSTAFAGLVVTTGESSGGGGTTNPNPTTPDYIIQLVNRYAQQDLWAVINAIEANGSGFATDAAAAYQKLFYGRRTIFDYLPLVSIELQLNEPCFDANGAPFDGSVYAHKPGAICISPFSMAPKLSDINAGPETLALILHELSHLLGTTEAEATAIQYVALGHLSKMDLDALKETIKFAPFQFLRVVNEFERAAAVPELITGSLLGRLRGWWSDLPTLSRWNSPSNAHALLVRPIYRMDDPELTRMSILQNWVCGHNEEGTSEQRRKCNFKLDKGFDLKPEATVTEIMINWGMPWASDGGDVIIRRPQTHADVARELTTIQNHLNENYFEQVMRMNHQSWDVTTRP